MSKNDWPFPFPPPPDDLVQYVGGGDFLDIGQSLCDEVLRAGLRPHHTILDVGCGVGRLAVPLTRVLSPDGQFFGFDIHEPSIDWCVKHISARFPNFHFALFDIFHPYYNPNGRIIPTQFRFPYADSSFDFISLWSVFTHLQIAEVRHYSEQVYRLLVPGGTALVSCFLLHEDREASGNKSELYQMMVPVGPGLKSKDPIVPETALAYDQQFLLNELAKVGFAIQEIEYGTWCGTGRNTFLGYQDKVIIRKLA